MSEDPIVYSVPLKNFAFLKPNYAISFHNGTEVVGKLDFNGPQMKFEGNADESVDALVRAFGHWFDGRLKQEREAERDALKAQRQPLTQKEAFELMDRAPRGLFYGTDMGAAQAIWLTAKDFTERAHGIGGEA